MLRTIFNSIRKLFHSFAIIDSDNSKIKPINNDDFDRPFQKRKAKFLEEQQRKEQKKKFLKQRSLKIRNKLNFFRNKIKSFGFKTKQVVKKIVVTPTLFIVILSWQTYILAKQYELNKKQSETAQSQQIEQLQQRSTKQFFSEMWPPTPSHIAILMAFGKFTPKVLKGSYCAITAPRTIKKKNVEIENLKKENFELKENLKNFESQKLELPTINQEELPKETISPGTIESKDASLNENNSKKTENLKEKLENIKFK